MKFNINNLTDAILDYMDKHEVKNPMEFPTLAFYKFVKESGLSDALTLQVTSDSDGKLKLMQLTKNAIVSYLQLDIKDPSIADPADDPKNTPISVRGRPTTYDNIVLDSDSSTDLLKKRVVIKRDNSQQAKLDNILTNEMKAERLNIYKSLSQYDTLSELSDNIEEYESMIHFGDKKLYNLSQAIFSYKEYQKSVLSPKKTDNLVIPSVLNKHMENILNSLISLSEKRVQQSTSRHYVVDQIAEIIRGDVSFSVPSLLVGSETLKIDGINKNVKLDNENMKNVELSDSILKTIKENVENGTLNNIIDDIYKKHISVDLCEEYALKLKLLTRQKTLEEKLENEDLNNFIEESKTKFPYIFKDNEIFSYKTGILIDKVNHTTISDVFNTFKLNDKKTEDYILKDYTDTDDITVHDLYTLTEDERYIRFIGETDASVKSLATGFIKQVSDTNENMKMLKIASLVFLNEEDNQFNEMAFNEIFSYCAKNKIALYINLDDNPFDDSKLILASTLKKVADNYKNSVLFIEKILSSQQLIDMAECKTDMATFAKQQKVKQSDNSKALSNKLK